MNIIYKTSPIGELKDIDEKSGIVKGYGSIFGNIDSDGDIISKGAYTKTIKENGDRVKYLYQHQIQCLDFLYHQNNFLLILKH